MTRLYIKFVPRHPGKRHETHRCVSGEHGDIVLNVKQAEAGQGENIRWMKREQQRKAPVATLFRQMTEDHRVAFQETNGVDPDWSIWHASYLLENGFERLLDAKLLKSDLIYLLVLADKQQISEATEAH